MKLPNADRAEVDLRKLGEYCLSPVHPVGRHKAAVFRAALDLTAADFERGDEFGDRYRLDFEINHPGRSSHGPIGVDDTVG